MEVDVGACATLWRDWAGNLSCPGLPNRVCCQRRASMPMDRSLMEYPQKLEPQTCFLLSPGPLLLWWYTHQMQSHWIFSRGYEYSLGAPRVRAETLRGLVLHTYSLCRSRGNGRRETDMGFPVSWGLHSNPSSTKA